VTPERDARGFKPGVFYTLYTDTGSVFSRIYFVLSTQMTPLTQIVSRWAAETLD
jgi:hypothetical protein